MICLKKGEANRVGKNPSIVKEVTFTQRKLFIYQKKEEVVKFVVRLAGEKERQKDYN